MSARAEARTRRAAILAAAAGLTLLAARPWIVASAGRRSPDALLVVYLATGVAAACTVRSRAAGRTRIAATLAVGLAAVVAVRALALPGPRTVFAWSALGLDLVAAAAEEALFRGALYGALERHGALLAGGVSAMAFALMHVPAYGWAALPVDLGAGVLFSWLRWASGRWEVPAAAHALANLLVVIR